MKFIHRLGYYLGGFAIGIIILMFFLNGKDASCDYGPNARTIKDINFDDMGRAKKFSYSEETKAAISQNAIDTLIVRELLRYGDVNFSESDKNAEPCKIYQVENTFKEREVIMQVQNCSLVSTIIDFKISD